MLWGLAEARQVDRTAQIASKLVEAQLLFDALGLALTKKPCVEGVIPQEFDSVACSRLDARACRNVDCSTACPAVFGRIELVRILNSWTESGEGSAIRLSPLLVSVSPSTRTSLVEARPPLMDISPVAERSRPGGRRDVDAWFRVERVEHVTAVQRQTSRLWRGRSRLQARRRPHPAAGIL